MKRLESTLEARLRVSQKQLAQFSDCVLSTVQCLLEDNQDLRRRIDSHSHEIPGQPRLSEFADPATVPVVVYPEDMDQRGAMSRPMSPTIRQTTRKTIQRTTTTVIESCQTSTLSMGSLGARSRASSEASSMANYDHDFEEMLSPPTSSTLQHSASLPLQRTRSTPKGGSRNLMQESYMRQATQAYTGSATSPSSPDFVERDSEIEWLVEKRMYEMLSRACDRKYPSQMRDLMGHVMNTLDDEKEM
eukprot:gene14027-16581_t